MMLMMLTVVVVATRTKCVFDAKKTRTAGDVSPRWNPIAWQHGYRTSWDTLARQLRCRNVWNMCTLNVSKPCFVAQFLGSILTASFPSWCSTRYWKSTARSSSLNRFAGTMLNFARYWLCGVSESCGHLWEVSYVVQRDGWFQFQQKYTIELLSISLKSLGSDSMTTTVWDLKTHGIKFFQSCNFKGTK
jgi:hypothetical protein